MRRNDNQTELDYEWVALIKEAKSIGLSIEEVRMILKKEENVKES